MPPKQQQRRAKKTKVASSHAAELARITKQLAALNKPKNQVTDLGRVLLNGGNAVSSMFGFPKVFGSGSYTMKNSLWDANAQVPVMHSSNESVRFKHREYIGDVAMAGPAYTSRTYNVNPGLPQTFPYLSSIASCFQEYSFKGLVFEYKTTSATALASGTNTAMGSVMLAAQYRSDAAPFVGKQALLNEMWSVDTVPSQNVILPIECAPEESVMDKQYIRQGPVTGDIKMFDLCSVTIATQGGQTGQTNVIGELWVSYDVELKKPELSAAIGGGGFDLFLSSSTAVPSNPLAGMLPSVNNTIGGIITGNTYAFPQGAGGYYSLYLIFAGGSVAMSIPPTSYNNCRLAASIPATAPGNNATGTQGALQLIVYISNASNVIASIVFGSGTFPTGSVTLQVSSLPYLPLVFN